MKLTVTVEDQVEKASIYSEAINYESCLLLRRWGCCFHGMPFVFEALSVVYQSLYYRSAETFSPKMVSAHLRFLPASCLFLFLFISSNQQLLYISTGWVSVGQSFFWLENILASFESRSSKHGYNTNCCIFVQDLDNFSSILLIEDNINTVLANKSSPNTEQREW